VTGNSFDLGIPGVTLAQRIGAGGNAFVYRARQPELDRTVVVKVLMVGDADQTQRRFDRERRAMGRLSQAQGIAPVYDSGFTSTGQPYLLMPYYENGSLQDRIELSGPLSPADVQRLGIEIADAVHTAHDNGVLHRDLKPANILITRSGRADVADFGIAQILDDSGGRSQAITMTPLYTAPEIFDGAQPSAIADVYSLGALLYALLNGRPAHSDSNANASVLSLMMKIKDQPLPELPDHVPTGLAAVVAKAMHKDPRKRYHSAQEMATALRAADLTPPRTKRARRTPRTSRPATTTVPAPQAARKRRGPSRNAMIAGAVAVVLVAVAAIAVILGLRDGTETVTAGDVPVEITTEPSPTPVATPSLPAALLGIDDAEIIIEAYSCGAVERARGVLFNPGVALTAESVAYRPWHADVIVGSRIVPANVVSYDRDLDLASLQISDGDSPIEVPRLGRMIDGAKAQVRTSDGSLVEGVLISRPDSTFGFQSSAGRLDAGSAVVNQAGALIGIVSGESPPRIVPLAGEAIEAWQPTAADRSCEDRAAGLGTDDISAVASPRLRELLQLQRLSEAYAAEEWDTVRELEPGKAALDDEAFIDGWRPLEQSYLFPVEREEFSDNQVRWRLGLIGHERWNDEDLTTLFCVWWEIDPATGSVIQTNEDTVRVYGPQQGEPRRSGWVDPGLLLGQVAAEC